MARIQNSLILTLALISLTRALITDNEISVAPPPREIEERDANALLEETQEHIYSTQLFLCKQKMQLSLTYLTDIIPILQNLKEDISDLVNPPSPDNKVNVDPKAESNSSFIALNKFKHTADHLDHQLTLVEEKMENNRFHLRRYSKAYREVESQLQAVESAVSSSSIMALSHEDNLEAANTSLSDSVYKSLLFMGIQQTSQHATSGVISECGGFIKSGSGSIVYKLDEVLNSYEGCVWIVDYSSNDKRETPVALSLKGANFLFTSRTYLSYGYFLDGGYSQRKFVWNKFGPSALEVEIPQTVVFIHFVASPEPGLAVLNKGFHLQFQALYKQSYTTRGGNFTNIFLTGPTGTFKYPPNALEYKDWERTAIVVQPTLPNSQLVINWWDFEKSNATYDSLSIYSFKSFRWQEQDRLLYSNDSTSLKTYNFSTVRNDPMLLIFSTDHHNSEKGFEFSWFG